MSHNILNDENNWKKQYKLYLTGLTVEELVTELNYVVKYNPQDMDETLEMKIRVNLIGQVFISRYDKLVYALNDKDGG
jgi:hypothetical protein